MLAEPVKSTSYVLQPRGKPLYEDENHANSFAMKMLTKMGWNKEKGLGAKEDGSKDFIRIRYKNKPTGMGFQDKDSQWTEHEEKFKKLLGNLGEEEDEGEGRECESLEEKSKNSRARVHYKKFTKGKDISQYSEKDLANIFGRKTLKVEGKKVENSDDTEPRSNFGVQTSTSRLSSADYFRQKMSGIGREEKAEEDTIKSEKKKRSKKEKKVKSNKVIPEEEEKVSENNEEEVPGESQDSQKEKIEKPEEDSSQKIMKKEKKNKRKKGEQETGIESMELDQDQKFVDAEDPDISKSKRKNKKRKAIELLAPPQDVEITSNSSDRGEETVEIEEKVEEPASESTLKDNETTEEPKKKKNKKDKKKRIKESNEVTQSASEEVSSQEVSETSELPRKKKKASKNEQETSSVEDVSPEIKDSLAAYTSDGGVIFKLPLRQCDIFLNLDSQEMKRINANCIIGYGLSEKIDLDVIESYPEAKEEVPEDLNAPEDKGK